MIVAFQFLKDCHRKGDMDIFCAALEGRTRTRAQKFFTGRSKVKIRKQFRITRAIKQWTDLLLGGFQANIGLPFIWDGFSPDQEFGLTSFQCSFPFLNSRLLQNCVSSPH